MNDNQNINLAALNQQQKGFILRPSDENPNLPPETPPIVPCCGYACVGDAEYPVMWNPYNKVVQCHNCGHIYVPEPEQSPLDSDG
jgi:hypothetical protein